MEIKRFRIKAFASSLPLIIAGMASCISGTPTPEDAKHLSAFHQSNYPQPDEQLEADKLSLFVDYSTCMVDGQKSEFFQQISASFVNRATDYYAIQGADINKLDIQDNGGVYQLLRSIENVDYAELKVAAEQASNGASEAVLLTDGEYFRPTIVKGSDNDPYLATAFKTWILRGHDIHIISEPYTETYKGQPYSKKRFYIIFTDDRLENNVYERIRRTVDFARYPEVDAFHLSASHPRMRGNGDNASETDPVLNCKPKGFGTYEIQDWEGCDWKTIEENLVIAYNPETGEELPYGKPIIKLGVDRNSFGCYRINAVGIKVWDINAKYNDFYQAKEYGVASAALDNPPIELEGFMEIDTAEFEGHSSIHIRFNKAFFDPTILNGKPYNYFKVDLTIEDVTPIFSHHEDRFVFQSISKQGADNVSVASSIKQCLADDEVMAKMQGQVIYSIYIKSEQQ